MTIALYDEKNASTPVQAPFPWFGGKSRAAPLIWQLLGNTPNYVEPFAGSLAVLLKRPYAPGIETVNDKDALIANAWRALTSAPDEVAHWCDWPVNEADQHAIHTWLLAHLDTLSARMMGDPDYYDAQMAGRWLYGINCWIGGGWCSGNGSWGSVDGQFVHLGNAGRGVHRQRVHLGDAGRGVHRKLVHLGDAGQGEGGLIAWFHALQDRLRYVRVCCGDWSRVCGPSVTFAHGLTGILFDPPYSMEEDRTPGLYRIEDGSVAHDVRQWCLDHGQHPLLRLVLCGYGTTHDALLTHGWRRYTWLPNGGYANPGQGQGRVNKQRETLWASPHCLHETQSSTQLSLFGEEPIHA